MSQRVAELKAQLVNEINERHAKVDALMAQLSHQANFESRKERAGEHDYYGGFRTKLNAEISRARESLVASQMLYEQLFPTDEKIIEILEAHFKPIPLH